MLLQVLTEPRNALGKQYKKMFAMNNVSSQNDYIPVGIDLPAPNGLIDSFVFFMSGKVALH